MCDVLLNDCEELYRDAVLYMLNNTCRSTTVEDHARSQLTPCAGIFQCNTLQLLHKNRKIWIATSNAKRSDLFTTP